jgi:hypothetical protein
MTRDNFRVRFHFGQILHSPFAFFRRGLPLLCVLGVFVAAADAQTDKRCAEAAALWIPSITSVEKTVVKWNKPLKYDIITPLGESTEIVHTIQGTLDFLARQAGLKAEVAQNPDVVVAVVNDISTVASPDFRKYAEDFLQELFSTGAYKGKGRIEIDPAKWEAKSQNVSVKCSGLDIFVNGIIVRAVNFVQADQSGDCLRVGFGELFGLINVRNYYLDHDRHIPVDLVAAAISTLYDKRVIAGSKQAEAEKAAVEVCKGP